MCDMDAMRQDIRGVAESYGLTFVVQFGSTARGDAGPMSDTDVLIGTTAPLSPHDEAALRADLSHVLHVPEHTLDLFYAEQASGLLVTRAIAEGTVLYGDPGAVRRMQLRAWRRMQTEAKFRENRSWYVRHEFAT